MIITSKNMAHQTLTIDEYKNNWKQFFADHELNEETKTLICDTINNIQSQDINIVITNYNSTNIEEGPRPFSRLEIGSIKVSLYCCGFSFNNGDIDLDYDTFQDQFYNNKQYSIRCIQELIFVSLFDDLGGTLVNIKEIYKPYFNIRFIET